MRRAPTTLLICFDTHTPYLAFRVRALQQALVARQLSDAIRLEVVLIARDEPTYGWQADELNRLYGGVPVRALSDSYRGRTETSHYFQLRTLRTSAAMVKAFWQIRPRVALVGGYNRAEGIALTLAARLRRCWVGAMHDARFNDREQSPRAAWREWMKSLVVRQFDFFLCSGQESVEYSQFLGGQRRPAYAAAWDIVDNEKIAALASRDDRDQAICAHLQLEPERPYFFMPIRFIAKKNALMAIDAYRQYVAQAERQALRPAQLVICGQGPLEAEYRARVAALGLADQVVIRPWLDYTDVPRACRRSQAVILASTHDQWGMTINEALAAGAPVLCSSRAGAHEVVRNNLNGFTFHPWHQDHLTALLTQLGHDQALVDRLRADAANSVRDFSVDQWLQACFDVMTRYRLIDSDN